MRIFVCTLMVLAGLPLTASAQSADPRGTASAIAGGGRTWDDEGGLGSGFAAGGRVDWRVFGNTSLEASVDTLSHARRGGFFEAEGRTAFVGVSLVHRFGSAAVRPYVVGGAHLALHTGWTRFDDVRIERDSADFGYHFGGGIAVRVTDRVEIGPEARFYMIQPENDADPAMAYWIGARVGIRF